MRTSDKVLVAAGAGALVGGLLWLWTGRSNAGPILEPWRQRFLDCVWGHERAGTLYEWGGGHGTKNPWGLDCSGLVNACADTAGFQIDMRSEDMRKLLRPVDEPEPGDLALYGEPDFAKHVRVVTAWHPDEGRAEAVGSEGGDRDVLTPEIARERDARVKRVADHRNRQDFLGFRSMVKYATGQVPMRPARFPSLPG
jgi:hypothetical protein